MLKRKSVINTFINRSFSEVQNENHIYQGQYSSNLKAI